MKRWVLKVERQNRFRLPAGVVECVKWLSTCDGTIRAIGYIGEKGQLSVLPPGSHSEARHKQLAKKLESTSDADGRSRALVALGRHIADCVTLTFSKEKHRVSVVMPEELRLLKCVPEAGEIAVLFTFGETLEIWRADDWKVHLHAVRTNFDKFVEDSSEELEGIGD